MANKKTTGSDLVTQDYLDVRLSVFKDEIKEIITENNSVIFERIDPLLKEIVDNREDREITTDKLEDHEGRLQKLEHS